MDLCLYPFSYQTLYPPASAERGARPRLIERLTRVPPPQVTLISAPAGFGKTTLVSEWIGRVAERTGGLAVAGRRR